MRTRRHLALSGALVAAGLLQAGCASVGGGAGSASTNGFAGFPACGTALITADPALYRETPSYDGTNAEDLIPRVQDWAARVPGFEQLWIDRDHHSWVTVGVHAGDVAGLQREIDERFPGEGVVVVEVPYTQAELDALLDEALDALTTAGARPLIGGGADVPRGRASLEGVVMTPAARAALAPFAGRPLCVDAIDPADLVPEGPQPTAGSGWRLLGERDQMGEAYRTDVATDDAQLAALWAESALPGTAPAVDWQTEIAVWFGAVHGSSCPIRLDGVTVEGATLYPTVVIPGSGRAVVMCTADAIPHSYVVAVQRSLLPDSPFVVQLDAEDPPIGAPGERTTVDVSLRAPGSRAAAAQIHRGSGAG